MVASVSPPGKYPGVYVQTIIDATPPTGGASTSVGALIGRTRRGPVNTPVTCLNFADFERQFGGLDVNSPVTYQASGFFSNGGTQAEIVRLYHAPSTKVTASFTGDLVAGPNPYMLTFAPTVAGPIVQVSTGDQFATTAPKSADDVYAALAVELGAEPAFAGAITNVKSSATGLSFHLSYPCSISGGGPVKWSVSPGTTASGLALLAFNASPLTFALDGTGPLVLTLTPPGGTPVSVKAQGPFDSGAAAAVALYQAIRLSAQASALVVPTRPVDANLTLAYANPVSVSLTAKGDNVTPTGPSTSFQLSAASPGAWGNAIVASVDTAGINQAVANKYGLQTSDLFNLTVMCNGTSERFTAVTLAKSAGSNRLDRVLAGGSALVALTDAALLGTPAPPAGSWAAGAGGDDSGPLMDADYLGDPNLKTGLYAFNQKPYGFNILSIPPDNYDNASNGGDVDPAIYQAAAQICADNNAMLIIDPPTKWTTSFNEGNIGAISLADLGNYTDAQARACAVYFPRVIIADPLRNGLPRTVVPSGFLAAVWAAVGTASGVWKAPAGLDAPIGGIVQLEVKMNDDQNGVLNPMGINALRFFTGSGNVVWGARTLRGADQLADPYKYIPVQRLLDYIETSLLENTRWAVFQPNGEALWSRLQTQIAVFMSSLFSQGAFAGTSASQAFFVKCDATTTTPADAAAGIVNVQVGFAPIYPAEFVVITISQITASSG
ncbi:phage tail sheath C-terminal domain-containing protein [Sorangium sp. So ce260]|uniref:phage tail sheath C-terminal domain-containing protein n=1 Tax=Sorangium sp. So ce260 TaxID=3133291 RepID=UPI003F5E9FF4